MIDSDKPTPPPITVVVMEILDFFSTVNFVGDIRGGQYSIGYGWSGQNQTSNHPNNRGSLVYMPGIPYTVKSICSANLVICQKHLKNILCANQC